MTFWKRQNYGDSKKISGGQWLGTDEKAEHRGFLGHWICSIYYYGATCHYIFVKSQRIHKTESEP